MMNITKQKIINIAISVIALVAIGLGGYFYYQLRLLKTNPQTMAKEEVTDLVSKISKIYLLPIGEDPTIATVSDPEALKNQSFFNESIKGDKVLIYTKAGKAILYRPSIGKIIETAPINNNKELSTSPTPEISSTAVTTTKNTTTKTPVKK